MKRSLSLAIVATFALAACTGSHDSTLLPGPAAQSTTQHVRHLKSTGLRPLEVLGGAPSRFSTTMNLYDAPLIGASATSTQFNAGILGVDAIDASGNSWQLIAYSTPQVVNLLALQNAPLALGSGDLPAGTYPSVQLLLDPSTTNVTYNGRVYPAHFVDPNHPWWDSTQTVEAVSVPLKLSGNGSAVVQATLDFNVFQSANLRNGVVYLYPTVAGGIGQPTIAGTVTNAAGTPVSNATVIATDANGNVANVTATAADGSYHLRGINPGPYTISVQNNFVTNAGVSVSASGADSGAAPSAPITVSPNGITNVTTLID
ncbi:MAG: carboxypeptidase regulatory-like domain-containing protein [Candidatus Elarobacter sp.]